MSKLFRLNTKKTKEDLKNFGVYVDKNTHNLLSLYCLYTEQTKSTVFRNLIDKWKSKLDVTEGEMLERLASRAANNWKGRWAQSDNWDKTFDEFITDIENTLRSRGLNQKQIEYIENRVKQIIDGTKNKEK